MKAKRVPHTTNSYEFEFDEEEFDILRSAVRKALGHTPGKLNEPEIRVFCRISDTKTVFGGDNSGSIHYFR